MLRKVTLFIFAVAFSLSAATIARADVIKLKFANYFPPTHMNSTAFEKYCKEINKRSNGKVEINYYTGGTLLTAPKMAAGIATGIADIGLSHVSYSRGRFPVMEVFELPLGYPSPWIATHAVNDFYDKFKPKEFDAYHALIFSTSPESVVQTLNKKTVALEDLKGLKLRATGRIADITKALGAVPVPIEIVDTYEALRRGVIDGNLGNFEQLKGFKLGEVMKYQTASFKIATVYCFYVIMNKNKWNSLPPDVQKVFTDVSREFVDEWAMEWNRIDIEGKDFFLKQGGQIVAIPDAEMARWQKAVEPVIGDFKKDMTSKGYKAAEVDSWINYIVERVEYWKGQAKERKIPSAYEY
jgi:TRAP-type C4-dicarboxylate transport system substrate-binding protein